MADSEFSRASVRAAIAAWMGFFVGPNAVLSSTQGQFMVPMARDFGLSRTMISVVFLISPLGVAVCLPAAGRAMDRWGLRRVLIPGLVCFSLCCMATAFVHSLWLLLVVTSLLSVTAAMHSSVGYAKVISQWFDRRRGTVLGLAVALGSGAGSALFPQFVGRLLASHGWRGAWIGLGSVVLALGLPVMILLLHQPPRDARAPAPMSAADHAPASADGATRREALTSVSFWLIFVAILCTMTALLGTVLHAFPMLTDRGFAPDVATTAVSLIFVGSIIGQFSSGLLLDSWDSPRAALPFFITALFGVLIVHTTHAQASLLTGAVLLGAALGAENGLAAYLTSRYFGLRAYGSIFSWVFSAACLGVAVGLLLMGGAHDVFGSYAPMRYVFCLLVLAGITCIALLGPYVYSRRTATPDHG